MSRSGPGYHLGLQMRSQACANASRGGSESRHTSEHGDTRTLS